MLSKGTEYAIRALVYLDLKGREGSRPGYREIAGQIEAPEQYTAKILQTLGKNRILGAVRGRGGGFFLEKDPSEITLLRIIQIMEGDHFFSKCGFGLKKDCGDGDVCPLHDKYAVIRDAFYDLVKSETIESLSARVGRGEAVLKHNNY